MVLKAIRRKEDCSKHFIFDFPSKMENNFIKSLFDQC